MRLAAKLVLLFLACLSIVVAVFSYLSMHQAEQLVLDEHEKLAKYLAASLKSSLERGPQSVDALERELAGWSARVQFLQLRLVNPNRREGRFQPLVRDEIIISATEVTTFRRATPDGDPRLITYVPLQDELGMQLEVTGQDQSQVNRLAQTLIHSSVALLAVTVVSSIAILWGGVVMVGRPLDRLVQKVREIGSGELSHPVEIASQDELGKLGEAVNEMCKQLVQQRARIEKETTEKIAAVESLRHADRLRTVGRLAAGLAHEIGTPLNVVSGRAELIAGGQLSAADVRASADAIKSESQRIAGIVRQLLDFARPSAPHRSSTDLSRLLDEILQLMRPLADKQGVTLQWSQTAMRQPAVAQVDAGQIQQVVTNLVVNAIQACGTHGKIWLDLVRQDRVPEDGPEPQVFWRISVRDDGPGIPADAIDNLFEPFYTTKDVGEGTGLGLAIAYGIVKEHGGWIEVDSQPEQGTEFSVFLPATQDES